MSIEQTRQDVAFVAAVLADIHERAGDEPLDTETQARWDEGQAFIAEHQPAIEAHDRREAQVAELRALAQNPNARVPGDGRDFGDVHFNRSGARDVFELRNLSAPGTAQRSSELRDRALEVMERHVPKYVADEHREQATKMIERENSPSFDADAVKTHIVRGSSPEYVEAWRSYLKNPFQMPGILTDAAARTAMSLTAANGGVLVVPYLDPTIVLTNSGANNNIRQISGHTSITVQTWEGVTSAGVTAEWIGEGSQVADASPTFVQPSITPSKADAYIFGSYEMLADTGFDQFPMLVADAKDRLEETAFTTGTGSSQPYGLVSRLSGTGPSVAGSSGVAGAADFVIADVYALLEGLTPRFRRNAAWLANIYIYDKIRQFATANNYHAFWTDLNGDHPANLLGKPAYEDEAMDNTIVSGSNDDILLFGDFRNYLIVDRVGMEIMYNPLVIGANQRPTGQAGFFAFWRVGADVLTSNAFKLLRV